MTFVATDRATVRDRKIPPEFFQAKTAFACARVFSHIKWSGPNRKSGICAYSPARTFQAIYRIHDFSRGVESDGTTDVLRLKSPGETFGHDITDHRYRMVRLRIDIREFSLKSPVETFKRKESVPAVDLSDGTTDFSSLKVLSRLALFSHNLGQCSFFPYLCHVNKREKENNGKKREEKGRNIKKD